MSAVSSVSEWESRLEFDSVGIAGWDIYGAHTLYRKKRIAKAILSHGVGIGSPVPNLEVISVRFKDILMYFRQVVEKR
jgi:hypothetical protein